MIRAAFSMLELVFVIVAMAILGVALMPSNDRDGLTEGTHNLARHIRMAQHYALMEDRFTPGVNWQETMWRIRFNTSGANGECYSIFADRNGLGNVSTDEAAIDPMTGKFVMSQANCNFNPNYDPGTLLWKSYGIQSVAVCATNTPRHVAFDHLGRPLQVKNSAATYLTAPCTITLTHKDGNTATITINNETGFVTTQFGI